MCSGEESSEQQMWDAKALACCLDAAVHRAELPALAEVLRPGHPIKLASGEPLASNVSELCLRLSARIGT